MEPVLRGIMEISSDDDTSEEYGSDNLANYESDNSADSESDNAGACSGEELGTVSELAEAESDIEWELKNEEEILENLHILDVIQTDNLLEKMSSSMKKMVEQFLTPFHEDITNMISNAVFLVDGDSLLLNIMGNKNYDSSNGGQMLHLIYLCERLLQLFHRKGGRFEIIFFNIWNQAWTEEPTLLLARSVLKHHLKFNMSFVIHEFESVWDKDFEELLQKRKFGFMLIDYLFIDVLEHLFRKENYFQELIYHVQICYSLVGLSFGLVDMNNVEFNVSTLNAFYTPPRSALGYTRKLRQILNSAIHKLEHINSEIRSTANNSSKTQMLYMPEMKEDDIRHIITVQSSVMFLKGETSPKLKHRKHLISVFLLYSALLECLPLDLRSCSNISITPIKKFVEKMQQLMNQALLKECQNGNYNFQYVIDLWHGNLLAKVIDYVTSHIPVNLELLGEQIMSKYQALLVEVERISNVPLELLSDIKNLRVFYEKKINKVSGKTKETQITDKALWPAQLIPMSCILTHEFCKDIIPEKLDNMYDDTLQKFIKRNSNFNEKRHWHSGKPLTDAYKRINPITFRKPWDSCKYFYHMSLYGASVEGRPLSSKPIISNTEKSDTCNQNKKKKQKTVLKKEPKLSKSAIQIIENKQKADAIKNEEFDIKELNEFKTKYDKYKMSNNYRRALDEVNNVLHRLKTEEMRVKGHLKKVDILWHMWIETYNTKIVGEKDLSYAKEMFLVLRGLLRKSENCKLEGKTSKLIGKYFRQMGLDVIAQKWDLPISKHREVLVPIGMSWVDFQLNELGPDLERETGKGPDKRVEGFVPDDWQRDLFNYIDDKNCVLVVAPTSSGKTYASYYCMEQVLREGDDGVVVYVAPTKALVNQVAATVYARFKNKNMPPGKSVFGVFTRDYCINDTNCQILITVPQCLELLLLSPRRHDWLKSLRYVIFDEIHCLAGQNGGFSWESGLLMIQCPFLALSATIKDPADLHNWFQSMQDFKKSQDIINNCVQPAGTYEVKLVVHADRYADLRKHVYTDNGKFQHIHPYAYLHNNYLEEGRFIPSAITLSPEEVNQLYKAMYSVSPKDPNLQELEPEQYFSIHTDGFLSRKAVREYEGKLKKCLEIWAYENYEDFENVVKQLECETEQLSMNERRFILEKFIGFIHSLQNKNMLPALVFSYNRGLVHYLFRKATDHYELIVEKRKDNLKLDERKQSNVQMEKESKDPKGIRNAQGQIDFRVPRYGRGKYKFKKTLDLLSTENIKNFCELTVKQVGYANEAIVRHIERRMIRKGIEREHPLPRGMRMGFGMHHGGMNAVERSSVEMLFRMKVLNVVFATGTLALGIHMPCKTVAIVGDSKYLNALEYQQMSGRAGRRGFDTAGNVVFMGLNERKMKNLMLGSLPKMIGNIPLNVSMVLRLLLLVNNVTSRGIRSEEVKRRTLSRAITMLSCCLVYKSIPELKDQMKHFFAFSTQFLMLQGLLDDAGNPQFLTGIVTHLAYHEPGNIAFVFLMKSGVLRNLCKLTGGKVSVEAQQQLVIVLSYLFAPMRLHKLSKERKYNNSKVMLPDLPSDVKKSLENGIINDCKARKLCSSFAALSGHTDEEVYTDLNFSNIRNQVFTDMKFVPTVELDVELNGYAWDFYNHGIASAIRRDNGLKEGEDFNLLKDFMLVLKCIHTSLSEQKPIRTDDDVFQTFTVVFTDMKFVPTVELDVELNGYAWDFYNHVMDNPSDTDSSEEYGSDTSSSEEWDGQTSKILLELAREESDIAWELHNEQEVLQNVRSLESMQTNDQLIKILMSMNKLIDKLLLPSYEDITNMLSNGAVFLVDGDSLLLHIMGNKNYDFSNGGQMLHFIYLCERFLQLFHRKGGRFEIIFFNIWNQAWAEEPTLLLARSVLKNHLKFNMSFVIHEFESVWDKDFEELLQERKFGFMLIDYCMIDVLEQLFHKENYFQELIYLVQICYSLVGLSLGLVDMEDVELNVSTLNAFYTPPNATLFTSNLRQILDKVICKLELISHEICSKSKEEMVGLYIPDTKIEDIRRAITVQSAVMYLKDKTSPEPRKEWIGVFLLYSVLLDCLPLGFRSCSNLSMNQVNEYYEFIKKMQQLMNHVLQNSQNGNCNYQFVADLWHGNLLAKVIGYLMSLMPTESVQVGGKVMSKYKELLSEVTKISEEALDFLCDLNNLRVFSKKLYEVQITRSKEKRESTCVLWPAQLIPTSCILTNEFCKDLIPDQLEKECDETLQGFIKRNRQFKENRHWHSKKALTDDYERVNDSSSMRPKDISKYSYHMSLYGASIEGRQLSSRPIVSKNEKLVTSKNKKENRQAATKKTPKLSKAATKIIEDKKKADEKLNIETDSKALKEFMSRYEKCKLSNNYKSALDDINLVLDRLKTEDMCVKGLLKKVDILWHLWTRECEKNQNDLSYAKDIFLVLRYLLRKSENYKFEEKTSKLVGKYFRQLGLDVIAQKWNLPISKHSEALFPIGMSWVDFQLNELGPDLERETGKVPDKRVEGFIPDDWQRDLFDYIDKKNCVLVVAPTSSGKTYASYYCMEQVLRDGNDGVVVYVAPTKALVNQVAATVYARFKNKNMPPGKSVYGVFTRDYRKNATNCQILITVPQCLEILLLSPRRHDWMKSLRYVIFDEIHCLAGQCGGFSWESGLLMIQCPFLALSATIKDPADLHNWFQSMQDFKKSQDILNNCIQPAETYKVELVMYADRHADLKKHIYTADGKFEHVHPYAYLDEIHFENRSVIPSAISLSPEEVNQLYKAMYSVRPNDPSLQELEPECYFFKNTDGFLKRKAVREYEGELKKLLENWVQENYEYFTKVVMQLKYETDRSTICEFSERRFIVEKFIDFIASLKNKNMLPAILFSYNRGMVRYLFEETSMYYELIVEEHRVNLKSEKQSDLQMEKESKDPKGIRNAQGQIDFRVPRYGRGKNKFEKTLDLLSTENIKNFCELTVKQVGYANEAIVRHIEKRMIRKGIKRDHPLPRGMRIGIGMHHGGLNAVERSSVEMLFRMKVLNVVFATGTLALGIHMPCKTVAIVGDSKYLNALEYQQMSGRAGRRGFDTAGNVVFMGLNERKMKNLMLGSLPKMIGNIPLNVSMVLHLLLLVNNVTSRNVYSEEAKSCAVSRAITMLSSCLVYKSIPELKDQMKHFFAFSTQFLMLQGLLDDAGKPQFLTGVVTHLRHHEPGNIAFVFLMKSEALRKVCKLTDGKVSQETQLTLITVLSYLFGPILLHKQTKKQKYENSKVILPPLPSYIKQNLESFVTKNCEPRKVCSAFAALSGHTDEEVYTHQDSSNIRHQVFTDMKFVPTVELDVELNGYAWDFYNHGIAAAIRRDNGLKEGEDFAKLKDFMMVLKCIETSLNELEAVDTDDGVLKTFTVVTRIFEEKFEKAYYLHNSKNF
ncbi:hypothetical protein C0J52_01638 [Blattella germanica]|nr:hypothetical protein C0J52_01638 [Blattella germanica]